MGGVASCQGPGLWDSRLLCLLCCWQEADNCYGVCLVVITVVYC